MELHVVRLLRYFDDLGEPCGAPVHLCRRHVVLGAAAGSPVALPRVGRAALCILNLYSVDMLPSALRKRADVPVFDLASDVNALNLRIQGSAISPRLLPEVISDIHLLGTTLVF